MALEEGRFFTGAISDRRFQADGIAEYFKQVMRSGVLSIGTNLQVTADGTAMAVNVNYGSAVVQGYGYWLKDNGTGIKQLGISAASPTYPRIDRVVIRLDKSKDTDNLRLAVLRGTSATSPVPPVLTRTDAVYEISLAQVRVEAGATSITAAKITDERADAGVCGVCTVLGERFPIDQELSSNGYCKLPNGVIMQWGGITITPTDIDVVTLGEVTYPIPFSSSSSHRVVCTPRTSNAGKIFAELSGQSATGVNIYLRHTYGTAAVTVNWMAIGY